MRSRSILSGLVAVIAIVTAGWMAPDAGTRGIVTGAPQVKSLGAMTFGPDNTLFIGDSEAGAIFALQAIESGRAENAPADLAGIDTRIAQLLGTAVAEIVINDMAVHPATHSVYLSVMRGRGADARPALVRVAGSKLEVVSLENVKFSMAPIPNAPVANPTARRNPRTFTVTDIAFADGQLWVAGLSNEEFSSAFRRMPYPFGGTMSTTTVEIYHVAHGANETNAPVMTFMPHGSHILAAYTCTPLVAFETQALKDGQHVFGRTVAELGAGNQPVDMIAINTNGRESILLANSRHPLMRVDVADIVKGAALKSPTKEVGITRVPLAFTGIRQLADLNATHIVVIQASANGALDLRSIAKATL